MSAEMPGHMKNTAVAIENLATIFSKSLLPKECYLEALKSLVRMTIVDVAMTEEVKDLAKCLDRPIAELG